MNVLIVYLFLSQSLSSCNAEYMNGLDVTILICKKLIREFNEFLGSLHELETNQRKMADKIIGSRFHGIVELWRYITIEEIKEQISNDCMKRLILIIEEEFSMLTNVINDFIKNNEQEKIRFFLDYNFLKLGSNRTICVPEEKGLDLKEFEDIMGDLKMKINNLEANRNSINELIAFLKSGVEESNPGVIFNSMNEIVHHFIPITMETVASIHTVRLNVYLCGRFKVRRSIEITQDLLDEIEGVKNTYKNAK